METINKNGLRMPKLGLGTWRMTGAVCQAAVEAGLAMGYRHVDTGQMYANEAEVGAGIAASGVARGDLHVTTKVWWENLAPDRMRAAMDDSLRMLRTDYVDLFMIHWPSREMDLPAAMATLVKLREEGKARTIGVANFPTALLRRAVDDLRTPLACCQFEYHATLRQPALLDFMRGHDLPIIAYSPLAKGALVEDPVLTAIGRKHDATASQVAIAWLLEQRDVSTIPKSTRPERLRENMEALRVRLDDADRAAIAAMPKDRRVANPPFHPEWDAAG